MKWLGLCVLLLMLAGLMLLGSGCEGLMETLVRFENKSASLTVYPLWNGTRGKTLAPGQKTDWIKVNPGHHTLQWKNAANGKALTATAWPDVPKGGNYTFPYND